jgi:hypothetical protein
LSSILDNDSLAISNGSQCVIHQWGPIGSEGGPQVDLYLNPAQTTSSLYANDIIFESQAGGGSYYANMINLSGGSSSAAALNYGHIVPGVWMTFTEHIIIDDGTNGNGTFQLWCTVPTSGLPSNVSGINDCQFQNYGGTYLWYNYNGNTARDHTSYGYSRGSGTCKFGIYNGGPGFHTTSSTALEPKQFQRKYNVAQGYSYGNVGSYNSTNTSGAQMEIYMSPIKVEINTGTISTKTIGPSGLTTSSNAIDASGYLNVQ